MGMLEVVSRQSDERKIFRSDGQRLGPANGHLWVEMD